MSIYILFVSAGVLFEGDFFLWVSLSEIIYIKFLVNLLLPNYFCNYPTMNLNWARSETNEKGCSRSEKGSFFLDFVYFSRKKKHFWIILKETVPHRPTHCLPRLEPFPREMGCKILLLSKQFLWFTSTLKQLEFMYSIFVVLYN